jgi:hypothetical protein
MSPNLHTHGLLWRALNEVAGGGDDAEALTAHFREALLAFGSETPDNLNCAERIAIANADGEIGPVLCGIRLADIAHELEDQPMPEGVATAFPDLTESDWNAFMRLTTLLYIVLARPAGTAG